MLNCIYTNMRLDDHVVSTDHRAFCVIPALTICDESAKKSCSSQTLKKVDIKHIQKRVNRMFDFT